MKKIRLLLPSLAICQLLACNGSEPAALRGSVAADTEPSSREAILKVAQKKVFFGHQSVGQNIIDGIGDLSEKASVQGLNLVESNDASRFDHPVFAHVRIGENRHPSLKLADFEKRIDAGIGRKADIAMLKFCYVDINARTEVEKLFADYVQTMTRLGQKYPNLVLVHVTVPLKTVERGLKSRIKQWAGLGLPEEYADNADRNRFNELMRRRYQGKEPLFDLALLEATAPDGTAETFTLRGKSYQALFPGYASDGGHLDSAGRRRVARELLLILSDPNPLRRP